MKKIFLTLLLSVAFILNGEAQKTKTTISKTVIHSWTDSKAHSKADAKTHSWTADNGNGTYTNPLFYDEFSDPDMIRVGSDFYLAGTTMHCVPGVVVLHSKDMVNWEFLSYANSDNFDLGPEFTLQNGKEVYGQGIWAPCIRYHNGVFYIFSNVNGHGLQLYTAQNPAGPWTHKNIGGRIYDLSALFDDSGKIYVVHGYDEVHITEVKPDFSGYVEGSDKVIISKGNAMGEGHHFYKINGKYYIISADYAPSGRMECARADNPYGPYETTVIATNETMGYHSYPTVGNLGGKVPDEGFKFKINYPSANQVDCVPMHQGGIIDLPNGDWWGWSMIDFHSVGRTTCISPVTWQDGWPYFGLKGNLGRSPRTWVKPNVGIATTPHAPYDRSDDFNATTLKPVWQWNHNSVKGKWSLTEKKGTLRLHTLPANSFLWARNTLTQRVIGPVSSATVKLDASKLKEHDIAGLGLLNIPCAWLGVERTKNGLMLREYNQLTNETKEQTLKKDVIWLRATGDFDNNLAQYSFSTDNKTFTNIGDSILMPYQLKTFQGTRYALFAFSKNDNYESNNNKNEERKYKDKDKKGEDYEGGYADFDDFCVVEPQADRSANLPIGKTIALQNLSSNNLLWASNRGLVREMPMREPLITTAGVATTMNPISKECLFRVIDKGLGRVTLQSVADGRYLMVSGAGMPADVRTAPHESEATLFQWQDLLNGHCMLLSLKTNRYVGVDKTTGAPYSADYPGATPDLKNGAVFSWAVIDE